MFRHTAGTIDSTALHERFLWGLAGGLLPLGIGAAADQPGLGGSGFVLGSVGGVLLVTHAKEGARPVPVALGTAVGGGIPLGVCAAFCPRGTDAPVGGYFLAVMIALVGMPLGGAVAHGL